MIETRNLWRTFERTDGSPVVVARGLNITISRGEFVCVVGPSGCGKTSLLHMVAGLLQPTSGEVVVAGRTVRAPGPDRGLVFQKDSVFPWMRVIKNVEYGLACRRLPKQERREIARRYLGAVGLSHVETAWPRELSGGMLKRVAIATVFANGAEVLLLDEPFQSLDYLTRRQLHTVLLNLWAETDGAQEAKRTILFVTHDIDEALKVSDRTLVMKDGDVVDDLRISLPRPRTDDDLASPPAIALKHRLLRQLGLDEVGGVVSTDATGGGAARP